MGNKLHTVINATGSYIPEIIMKNEDFLKRKFNDQDGELIRKPNEEIIRKFREITGINERRHVPRNMVASDIGFFAAKEAIESSGIDKESLGYVIFAHNFGDITEENRRSDFVPSLAARIKNRLEIENPYTIAYDIPFGCPGWLQGVIQADNFLKSNSAGRALVIGAETLSRISDPHDRDSMLYSDGAGAAILESVESDNEVGFLSHSTRSDTRRHSNMLRMDHSYNPDFNGNELFLKMQGHQLYKYALQNVPGVVKDTLDKAGIGLDKIKKIFIHQANEKMDEEIVRRIYSLYGMNRVGQEIIADIMPMTISWLGNSSVATLPTLLDLTVKHKMPGHNLNSGDYVVFASVGAGMNINAAVYKMP